METTKTRVGPLKSLTDVSREMARLYKLGRRKDIDLPDMSRLANVLNLLTGCIKAERELDLHERLTRLEEAINE